MSHKQLALLLLFIKIFTRIRYRRTRSAGTASASSTQKPRLRSLQLALSRWSRRLSLLRVIENNLVYQGYIRFLIGKLKFRP